MLEKYLVYFSKERMHEATFNLHNHAWILFRLSIASVDGKLHLSEVFRWEPFNGLLSLGNSQKSQGAISREPGEPQESGFSPKILNQVRGMCWSILVMEAPIACWTQLRSLAPHSIMYATEDIPIVLFSQKNKVGYISNTENPTRALNTPLLKCCLPSTNAIDKQEKIHAHV